ncbi:MAG: DUF6089 family protein [Paludibacter sp.]|nr:DUF6089 family protein [Paludibacter sp.]
MAVESVLSQQIFTTEVGFHGGESYFIGDVKTKLKDMKPDYGFTIRHLFNQRLSLQADFNHTSIKGSFNQHFDSIYTAVVDLNQEINMVDFSFVFNFLDYGQLDHVLKSSNYSAYLFAGIGLIQQDKADINHLNFSVPFGMGFKMKLNKRLHMNLQWTHRLMLYDRLEGQNTLENPLGLNGSNIYNNDQAGTVTIGLSYGLFQRNCKCLNYK